MIPGVIASSVGTTATSGLISTFTWVDDGTPSGTQSTYTVSFNGGSGTGATFTIARTTRVVNLWYVTNVTLSNAGSGYKVNDVLTFTEASGNNIYVTVTAVV